MLFWFWPTAVAAHVRWFVETADTKVVGYALTEPAVQLAIGCVCIGLVACALLVSVEQRLWQRIKLSDRIIRIIRWVGIACLLVTPFLIRHWSELLPHLGFVLYLLFLRRSPRLALACLAGGVGVNLMIMALDEKLLNPGLAVAFLQLHSWNFFTLLGIDWFTDRLFTLYAGSVELTLGIAMSVGLSPRFIMLLTLTVLFTTPFLLELNEILGHIMLIICLVVFLFESTRIRPWSILARS